jgi:TonB family protein
MPIVIAAGVLIVLAAIYALVHLASNRPERAATPATTASQPAATTSTLGISPANANANSPGTVLNRVLPNPSVSARNTIHGKIKVRVKVDVDSSGNVAGAKFVTVGPSKYFSRLAMEAARQWKFKPPTAKGQPSRSEWTLLFEFTRGGTEAVPQESR